MTNFLKDAIHKLGAPVRLLVRHELRRYELDRRSMPYNQDIGLVLQTRATESSARYVEERMAGARSVTLHLELLRLAIDAADLVEHPLVCEFGVFSGTTTNYIASQIDATVFGFDSFEGLPERWRDGFEAGAFSVSAMPDVRSNVVLVKGWFDQTLPGFVREHPESIGLLHVDCDLYSSTNTIFENLGSMIKPGCVIVFDEYFNYPGWQEGEYLAFKEFIERSGLAYKYIGYNRLHEQVAVKILPPIDKILKGDARETLINEHSGPG